MPDPSALIGKTVGKLELVELLGAGPSGAVYLARHPTIGGKAAVKVLSEEQVADADSSLVRRFLDEARAVNLVSHPGIVRIQDCGTEEGVGVYLLMEHLEGASLARRVAERGPLPPETAARLLQQAASALAAAHEAGIIHRGLRPSSLFVVPDPEIGGGERVKVLDFGLAKLIEERDELTDDTRTGTVLGDPRYMPPEQALDAKRVDARADIYALAAVGYHLLAGRPPYAAASVGQLVVLQQERPTPLRKLRADVSEALAAALERALEPERERRFASMEEFRAALQAVLDAPAPPPSPLVPARPEAPERPEAPPESPLVAPTTEILEGGIEALVAPAPAPAASRPAPVDLEATIIEPDLEATLVSPPQGRRVVEAEGEATVLLEPRPAPPRAAPETLDGEATLLLEPKPAGPREPEALQAVGTEILHGGVESLVDQDVGTGPVPPARAGHASPLLWVALLAALAALAVAAVLLLRG